MNESARSGKPGGKLSSGRGRSVALETALLDAIKENPADDALRLKLADWLDRNGECERAEMVRLQTQLHNLSEDDPQWYEVAERNNDLVAEHGAGWIGSLQELVCECHLSRLKELRLDAHTISKKVQKALRHRFGDAVNV